MAEITSKRSKSNKKYIEEQTSTYATVTETNAKNTKDEKVT